MELNDNQANCMFYCNKILKELHQFYSGKTNDYYKGTFVIYRSFLLRIVVTSSFQLVIKTVRLKPK